MSYMTEQEAKDLAQELLSSNIWIVEASVRYVPRKKPEISPNTFYAGGVLPKARPEHWVVDCVYEGTTKYLGRNQVNPGDKFWIRDRAYCWELDTITKGFLKPPVYYSMDETIAMFKEMIKQEYPGLRVTFRKKSAAGCYGDVDVSFYTDDMDIGEIWDLCHRFIHGHDSLHESLPADDPHSFQTLPSREAQFTRPRGR